MYELQLRICICNTYLNKKSDKFSIKTILHLFEISNGTLYNREN